MEIEKKRGRPRLESKTLYTTIIMTKKQRDKIDNYMWDNRIKMSYAKFIEHCIDQMEQNNKNEKSGN